MGGTNHSAETFFNRIRQEKEKARAAGASDNIRTEWTSQKCFRCGSEVYLISKYPKPPKDNERRQNQVRFNEKGNRACDNSKNNSDHKIYAYMARRSNNDEFPSGNFGESSKLTNQVFDSRATCHMTPEVSDFIPGSLEDTYKYVEVADGHHVTAKHKGQVQIKMWDNHGNPFIATLHYILLAPDLCDRLF